MERKLASIQTILEVLPHTNADTLEIVKVLGWTCVVLKGQFQKGQQVVYIEPDAILPEGKPEWEFMRSRGFRIKTIKLRGQVSQGLVFSLSVLPLMDINCSEPNLFNDGDDVTAVLGITKYEPYVPAQLAGIVKGNFPEFLHKTDEMRIQGYPILLEKHKGKLFSVTEKVDGSSFTAFYNNGEFGVCSRNLELKEDPNNSFWKVALELDIKGRLAALRGNHAIQGELVGQGIQGNKYKLNAIKLFVFNLFNIDKRKYYDADDFLRTVKEMGLETVPVVNNRHLLNETVDELVTLSNAPSVLNKDTLREGIVLRPIYETFEEELRGRLSFKCINPNFLLKYNE